MLKPFAMLGSVGVLAVSALGLSVQGYINPENFQFFRHLPKVDASFNEAFRHEFLRNSNDLRSQVAVPELKTDYQVQSFVSAFLQSDHAPETIELNTVFDSLQNQFPGAQYLAANLVSAVSRVDLMNQLSSWDELADPEFHDLSSAVVKSGRRMVAMIVLSRRIPKFCIDAANEKGGRFFNQCPHCRSVHALDLHRKNKTLILSCPDCLLSYDVLAADATGEMRRAVDYFSRIEIPHSADSLPPKEKILAIWNIMADRCSYEADSVSFNGADVWKTSLETWEEKTGDCEDTSILLVDALCSVGIEARVAIGWNGNIGQHAWVVVNVEGEQFVLETTLQGNPGEIDMVPAKEASFFYRPEQLFDREHLYFLTATAEEAAKDYFSPLVWKKVRWD